MTPRDPKRPRLRAWLTGLLTTRRGRGFVSASEGEIREAQRRLAEDVKRRRS